MNEEKLNEVGALTEVDSKDLTKKKIRNKITLVYYYLIQFAFFILSSLGGLVLGLYGKSIVTYPYVSFSQRYIYGPIIIALAHGGNFGLSYQLSRKKRLIMKKSDPKVLTPSYIYPAIALNILLSTLSLFAIYNIILYENILTINTLYGVYVNKHKKFKKNLCWAKQSELLKSFWEIRCNCNGEQNTTLKVIYLMQEEMLDTQFPGIFLTSSSHYLSESLNKW